MNHKHMSLLSEIEELERILESIPVEDIIDRFSFLQRLEAAKKDFADLPLHERARESLKLTFRGTPVSGSHGISADFAGRAANAFADAFAAIMAGLNSTLRYMGPIPDKTSHPLLITGTAVGSFGFELELPVDTSDLFPDKLQANVAVEKFKSLLRVSCEGTDDDVSDIMDEIHPRAVRKVADFLHVLSQSNAWCGLEFRGDYFRYRDIDQLNTSEDRLRKENIEEQEIRYFGELQGVLPKERNFEFIVAESNSIIKAKVGPEIDDPDILNREWLHKPLTAKFMVVQVGQGRPRYTLSSLADLIL